MDIFAIFVLLLMFTWIINLTKFTEVRQFDSRLKTDSKITPQDIVDEINKKPFHCFVTISELFIFLFIFIGMFVPDKKYFIVSISEILTFYIRNKKNPQTKLWTLFTTTAMIIPIVQAITINFQNF